MEPQENEPVEETTEPQAGEPASAPEKKKSESDSDNKVESESQKELLKRYKEQLSGQQKGFDKILQKLEEQDKKIADLSQAKKPSSETISDENRPYKEYYKKLGFIDQEDMEKEFQKRIAPLTEGQKAAQKAERQKSLDSFIKKHPDLSKEEDPAGDRMQKVIEKLRRVAPAVPSNPNFSLDEDLELAYNWAFGKSDLEEFRQKAKATGQAEALEALEAQVGGGSSVATTKKKKVRTPEQEAMLKRFGVDDETLSKKKYPKGE